MDCQVIDSKILLSAGSFVSVPPNHLTLEVEVPKREKPKFTLKIKPMPETLCDTENIDFMPTVNLDKDIMILVDESTPGPSKSKRQLPPKNYNED